MQGSNLRAGLYTQKRNRTRCCNWSRATGPLLGSGEEECRMEECVNRARGADTLFPVCISCVLNVKLGARACFLCVMGARPRHPDMKTTHQARLMYTHTGSRVYALSLCLCVCLLKYSFYQQSEDFLGKRRHFSSLLASKLQRTVWGLRLGLWMSSQC